MSMLALDNVSVSFGGIKAVQDVSFSVEKGEVFSIIGPNGAGKTTLFNLISRFYEVDGGTITYEGENITRIPTHKVASHGIARTFQNTELFEHETVLKNLMIGHRFEAAHRSPSPIPVDIHRQQVVHAVVPGCDLPEHLSHPFTRLIYTHILHSLS